MEKRRMKGRREKGEGFGGRGGSKGGWEMGKKFERKEEVERVEGFGEKGKGGRRKGKRIWSRTEGEMDGWREKEQEGRKEERMLGGGREGKGREG